MAIVDEVLSALMAGAVLLLMIGLIITACQGLNRFLGDHKEDEDL